MNVEKNITVGIFVKSMFFFAMLLMTLTVYGQAHYSSNVAVGVKGGVDFSKVFFNPSVSQKISMGMAGGVAVRYVEEDHFGLIAELNFVQRGWTENFEEAPYNYQRTLNYIELPVLAHIYFGRRGRFFINAGPQVGLYLGDSTKSNFDPKEMATLPDFPYRNRMNGQMLMDVTQTLDYGISAGIGAEFNITKRNSIAVEARFYYGLGNIFPSKRSDTYSGSNMMSVMATLGYWFRIK